MGVVKMVPKQGIDVADVRVARGILTGQRFGALDAMRGVAAVLVICIHASHGVGRWSPVSGRLAVDLFFVLSGFVLSLKYDPRFVAGMTAIDFMAQRAIRLFPLVLLGTVIGVFTTNLNPDIPPTSWPKVIYEGTSSFLAIPAWNHRGVSPIFPLDVPLWSIFFEFWVANLAFAVFWRWLKPATLGLIMILGLMGLFASHYLLHGFLAGVFWSTVAGGLPRVLFSFFAGVALARMHHKLKNPLPVPGWLITLATIVALILPLDDRAERVYELLFIVGLGPALVFLGARSVERRPIVGKMLGEASYAAYTIHYPLWAATAWLMQHKLWRPSLLAEVLFCGAVTLLAWVVARVYDQPVQNRGRQLYRALRSPP